MIAIISIVLSLFGLVFIHTLFKFGIRPQWKILSATRKHAFTLVFILLILVFGVSTTSIAVKHYSSLQNENQALKSQLTNGVMSIYNWLVGRWSAGDIDQNAIEQFAANSFYTFSGDDARLYQILRTGKHLYEHHIIFERATTILKHHRSHCEDFMLLELIAEVKCEKADMMRMTRRFKFINNSVLPCNYIILPFGGETANTLRNASPSLEVHFTDFEYKLEADSLIQEIEMLPPENPFYAKRKRALVAVSDDSLITSRCYVINHKLKRPLNPNESFTVILSSNWASVKQASVIATNPWLYSNSAIKYYSLNLEISDRLLDICAVSMKAIKDNSMFVIDKDIRIEETSRNNKYIYSLEMENLIDPIAVFFLQNPTSQIAQTTY